MVPLPALGVGVALLVLVSPWSGVAVAPELAFENGSVVFGAVVGLEAVQAPPPEPLPVLVLPVPVLVPVLVPVEVPVPVEEPAPVLVPVEEPVPLVGSVLTPVAGGVDVAGPHEFQSPALPGDSVADTAGEPVSLVTPPAPADAHGSDPLEVQVAEAEPAPQLPVGSVVVPDGGEIVPPVVSAGGATSLAYFPGFAS